jgi:uncharacterized protein YcbX
MVVDEEGVFMSQRAYPKMALLTCSLPTSDEDGMTFTAPGMSSLQVSLCTDSSAAMDVMVWDDHIKADDQGADAAAWFTKYMGKKCRLVRMQSSFVRATDAKFAVSQTSLSDGFPILLASEESLADLNSRLVARGKEQIPMDRFRPNIVVKQVLSTQASSIAFPEDLWGDLTIGTGAKMRSCKPCSRCSMPGVDQVSIRM